MYYACGGFYRVAHEEYKFFLVKPTGNSLPYITNDMNMAKRLYRLCQHHSHLYGIEIGPDWTATAGLITESFEATGVKTGSDVFKIPNEEAELVKTAIINEHFWKI